MFASAINGKLSLCNNLAVRCGTVRVYCTYLQCCIIVVRCRVYQYSPLGGCHFHKQIAPTSWQSPNCNSNIFYNYWTICHWNGVVMSAVYFVSSFLAAQNVHCELLRFSVHGGPKIYKIPQSWLKMVPSSPFSLNWIRITIIAVILNLFIMKHHMDIYLYYSRLMPQLMVIWA